MNIPSHIVDTDLRNIAVRLHRLEEHMAQQQTTASVAPAPVPSPLPVDKMQLADYGRLASPEGSVEDDSDEDEAPVNPMSNLTQHHIRELVAAFDDYIRWKESPNRTMDASLQLFIEQNSLHRLEEAMTPLQQVIRKMD